MASSTPANGDIKTQLESLRNRKRFPSFSDDTIALIAADGRVRTYAVETSLFNEGDAAESIYIVLSGHVAVVHIRHGRQYVLHDERDGGTLGEVPAFSGTPYLATAICRMSTTCVVLSIATAKRLVKADAMFAEWIIERLGDRIKRRVTRVESASALSTTQRIARFLLERNSRAPAQRFRLGMSQNQLAEELGTVREVVSRTLTQLEDSGAIEKHSGGWITVNNRAKLSSIAEV